MPSDDEIKQALKNMGISRSVMPVHIKMLLAQFCPKEVAATTRAPSGVLFNDIAISELPEAGEYERGYNKAIELMRRRLETGYGAEETVDQSTAAGSSAPRAARRHTRQRQ